MKFKTLREKRLLLQGELEKLINAADTENRALTDAESKRFDEIEKEIQGIDATLATEERARKLQPVEDKSQKNDDDGKTEEQRAKETAAAEERAFEDYIRGKVIEDRADDVMTYTDNGAVIPNTVAHKILQRVTEICPIFSDAERYNIPGTLSLPYYDEESGDIVMEYAEEGTEGDATSGSIKSITLKNYLARAITDISKSLINNSNFPILNFVINRMALSIAKFIEKELLIGTDGKIEGLRGIKKVVTGSTAGTITADDLIDVQEEIPDVYQGEAYWIMHKETRKHIRKLKDGQGNYLLNKDATSRWGYTLFGKDVFISDNMPKMGDGGNVIIYGDMKGLAVKISENINIEVLRETKARKHLIEVLGFVELDAKVQNAEMIAGFQMKTA